MWTKVLRGDSGSPADPKDAREYVGLNVALKREIRQPETHRILLRPTSDTGAWNLRCVCEGDQRRELMENGARRSGRHKTRFTSSGKPGCMPRIPGVVTWAGKNVGGPLASILLRYQWEN